ncbi:hypothetical protein [Candidatus Nitrosarchaeum limnium]|uniref:hypothetical protein n=1 Tax=Candidatus Nitrosarchaeum limnium TaxID=1007084 RepID=UPI0010641B62|nr:hypothetical protein [Candidatus Nitrosarchaeum limnium]
MNFKNQKIISFDYDVHNYLDTEKISHTNSDEYLSKNERIELYDKAISLSNWHDKNPTFEELKFEGINLLSLIDAGEFHQFILEKLIKFMTMIRIIQKENPKRIFLPTNFLNALSSTTNKKNIKLIELKTTSRDIFYWNKITFKFNFLSRTFSISLSRNRYNLIKNYAENFFKFIIKSNDIDFKKNHCCF